MSMNHFLKALMVALLVTASAQAIVWDGGANTDDWFTGLNWDTDVPPVATDWTLVVDVTAPAVAPVINEAVTNTAGIEVGDGTRTGTLYVADGADIQLSSYNYNRLPANGYVYQSGGTITANSNTWCSRNTAGMSSVYELTGGSFTLLRNRTYTFLNRRTDADARVNAFGGDFIVNGSWRIGDSTTAYQPTQWGIAMKNGSTVVMPWTQATAIGYVTAATQNLKSANPKEGLLLKWAAADTSYQTGGQYNPYYMTAKAVQGLATLLTPLDQAATAPGATDLKWINADAFYDGTSMTRQVRFGTYDVNETTGLPVDPNGDTLPVIATLTNDEPNYVVTCVYGENYMWRVDSVDPGNGSDANYPKTIPSRANIVICRNQAPVVTIPSAATTPIGLRDGSVAWTTTATATDDGLPIGGPALAYEWTQISGPAVTINNASTPSPSITFTAANTYTLRCSVSDSDLVGTADVSVTVYVNVCEASKARSGYTAAVGDINADCWVSFVDVALMASNWCVCNSLDPADPACTGL